MNKSKRLSIGIGFALICVLLGVVSYTVYRKLANKVKLLEEGLEDKSQVLGEAEVDLFEAKRKNTLFVAEKERLSREIASQKKRITEIQQAQDHFQKQQAALTAEKKGIEDALEYMKKMHQKQIQLYELKDESREKDFKKKVDSKMMEFITDKKALQEQVKNIEAKLKGSVQENQELLTKLNESGQTAVKRKAGKGEESSQLDSMEQEEEWFRKQDLKFYYNKGLVYEQASQYKKALREYKKALEAVADDADVHYNLAILYDERLNNKRKAIEHYQAYLKFCPDAQDAAKVNYWIVQAKKEIEWKYKTK